MLKRQGHEINHKRVARLMAELGLVRKRPVKRKRTTNSNHEFKRYPNLVMNLGIDRPDQVWVGDITYIKLQQEFVYLAVLMDVFTRSIRGWHLARSMDGSLTITALKQGLEKGRPDSSGIKFVDRPNSDLAAEDGAAIRASSWSKRTQGSFLLAMMVGNTGYMVASIAFGSVGLLFTLPVWIWLFS